MKQYADISFGLSIVAIILAIIGAFGYDLWLASTQWLLVSISLVAYAIYCKIR